MLFRWLVRTSCFFVISFLCLWLVPSHTATPSAMQSIPNQLQQHNGDLFGNSPQENAIFHERRVHALNLQRHNELVSDTQKLLKLSTQLHDEVGKRPSADLTPAQLRELAQIEKLAKSVREKMTDTVGEPDSVLPQPFGGPFP